MSIFKKVLITLLAVAVFLGTAAAMTDIMLDRLSFAQQPEETVDPMAAFPHAVTKPTEEVLETEPVQTEPPETVPPETLPPETLPPETVPVTQPTEPKVVYDTVPLLFMTDYPEIRYGLGTMATSGSNVASLAMVASYLTGHEYTPDVLLECFADYIGNNMQWLEYAADQLQLPWEKAENFHVAKQALQEGKVVITLLGENSIFTQTQHFIVLTGINDAGRILVNDPFEDHYTQWNLKQGLAEGFPDKSIITGYKGSWIFDPEAMPEEPFIYKMEPNTDTFRYAAVELTEEEIDMMAKLICMEAQSEPFEGQQAIAEVIFNRLIAGNFQSSVASVIQAEGQFKSSDRLYLAKPTHIQYKAIERALYGPYVLPKEVVFFASYPVNDDVWGTIGNHTFCYQW